MRPLLSRLLVALALVAAPGGVRGDAPLTTADLVRFLKAGIGEKTILTELENRGFSEPLDFDRETSLREAGASETLVVAVRRTAPPEVVAAPVAPAPPRKGRYEPPVAIVGPPGKPGETLTFATATRTVRVPVSVLDNRGQPLMGLHGADFRISEEGKRQQVTLFSGERQPLRIAMALDVSGSMRNKIRQVERSLRYFIELLEPADQIMVVTFNDRVRVVQDFTSDRELLYRILDELEPIGGTALYDAAYEAISRVGKGPAETKAVVLVSDGVDTTSGTTFNELRDLARRAEVPVYSIGLSGTMVRNLSAPPRRPGGGEGGGGFPGGQGRRRPPGGPGFPGGWPGGGGRGGTPDGGGSGSWPGGGGGQGGGRGVGRGGFDAGPLIDLADETGGRAEILEGIEHYSPDDETPGSARLQRAVESIALTLRHRYLIGYEPPAAGKRGWRRIEVEIDRPSATARAKKGYYSGG